MQVTVRDNRGALRMRFPIEALARLKDELDAVGGGFLHPKNKIEMSLMLGATGLTARIIIMKSDVLEVVQ